MSWGEYSEWAGLSARSVLAADMRLRVVIDHPIYTLLRETASRSSTLLAVSTPAST